MGAELWLFEVRPRIRDSVVRWILKGGSYASQQSSKGDINLTFIVKPISNPYVLTAAGRLRRGDLLMGPPLKAGWRCSP